MSRSAPPEDERPWWLTAGPARCTHCLRSHHIEIGIRCTACDEPVCPFCVVTVRETETLLCPSCEPEADG